MKYKIAGFILLVSFLAAILFFAPANQPVVPAAIQEKQNTQKIPRQKNDEFRLPEKIDSKDSSSSGLPPAPEATPLNDRIKKPVTKTRLEALETPSDIEAFLEDVKMDNLAEALKSAQILGKPERPDPNLGQLSGRFSGVVTFENTNRVLNMIMDSKMSAEGKDLLVEIHLRLSENGEVLYDSLNGPSEGYRYIDLMGLILVTSSKAYFQLFYLPRSDRFIGNYYEKFAPEKIIPKGIVVLRRNRD